MTSAERTRVILEQVGALRAGHFVLSSGLHSDRYCQCATLFRHPDLASEVAGLAKEEACDIACDLVCAPALGGVLWGYELARALHLPSIFAERQEGAFTLRRGFTIEPGQRVLLAEDVVTTGGSVMELVPLVERAGGSVAGIVSVVDRSKGSFNPGCPFVALTTMEFTTYAPADCALCAQGVPTDKPGSRRGGSS
ncbi:MAG: orotate phosphoribosyltransferase [Phycisphaerales bacterium]